MPESIEVFRDLTVKIGSRLLLAKANLKVQKGTITALMGPSGVGKSLLSELVFNIEARGGVKLRVALSRVQPENAER